MWKPKRAGSRPSAGGLFAVALLPLALASCQSDEGRSSGSTKPKPERDPAIGSTLPEAPAPAMNAAANDTTRSFPLDATPSPDGSVVYYAALSSNEEGDRVAGVFRVGADGG